MEFTFWELFLIIVIITIGLYLGFAPAAASAAVLGGVALAASSATPSPPEGFRNEYPTSIPVIPAREDNLQEEPSLSVLGGRRAGKSKKYKGDEYDDGNLLGSFNSNVSKAFNSIVVDGTNFIYALYEYEKNKSASGVSSDEYLSYMKKSIKLLSKHFAGKDLYVVFKDPETEHQTAQLLQITGTSDIKSAHKKLFDPLLKGYEDLHIVVAYGDAKYRDDYAAIWLADVIGKDSILLSRDRYRDVSDMENIQLSFVVYGRRAEKLTKLFQLPFSSVSKSAVKANLVGYTFGKQKKSGFYNKDVKKESSSDLVYVFGIKK